MALNAVVRSSEIGPLGCAGAPPPQAARVRAASRAAEKSLVFMAFVSCDSILLFIFFRRHSKRSSEKL